MSLYMAPALCLLAGVGLSALLRKSLRPRWMPVGIRTAALVLAAVVLGGIVRDLVKPYKKRSCEINRRAMRWLAEQTGPGDRWAVFNALTDVPHAPNLRRWGGSAARFQYYVGRFADSPVLWAPAPEEIAAAEAGRTWVIVYRDNDLPMPEEKLTSYLTTLEEGLGPSHLKSFDLGRREAIEIHRFSSSRDSAPSPPG